MQNLVNQKTYNLNASSSTNTGKFVRVPPLRACTKSW